MNAAATTAVAQTSTWEFRMSFSATQYPYSSVVRIDSYFPNGTHASGSGTLVAPDEVLTASHVVWEQGVGQATRVTVTPAFNRGSAPFGTASATNWHYFQVNDANGVETPTTAQSDIAMVHLDQLIGTQAGSMDIEPDFHGGMVHVTGYPASFEGVNYNAEVMIDRQVHASLDPDYTLLDLPSDTTNHGDSGGPMWVYEANGRPAVVGVEATGGRTGDQGPIITAGLARDIQQWYAADHAVA